MNDTKKLNNNELKKMSDGNYGEIPAGGIVGELYNDIEAGCFYSREQNPHATSTIINVENKVASIVVYREETLSLIKDDFWYAIHCSGVCRLEVESFKDKYPYKLNIRG